MSGMAIGLWIFAGLLVLLAMRIHVGVGMFVGGALLGVGSAEVFDYFWPESKK